MVNRIKCRREVKEAKNGNQLVVSIAQKAVCNVQESSFCTVLFSVN